MSSRRRPLLLLVVVLFGSMSATASLTPGRLATAGGPAADPIYSIPVRWCAMENTTVATNPGAFGEPDTDSVLWRRHERATDQVWTPQANITWRSSFTWQAFNQANFPILTDPSPPPTGAGQRGDVLDPSVGGDQEFQQVRSQCEAAWSTLSAQVGVPNVGVIAVSIRRFVNAAGTETNLWGWGGYTALQPGTVNICTNPGAGTSYFGGAILIVDPSTPNLGAGPVDAELVAHELGHVLMLGHGNGLDDDGDGVFDDNVFACDDDAAEANNQAGSLMSPNLNVGAMQITPLQRARSRAIARVYSGVQVDPPAVLINGETTSDQRADPYEDVASPSVDMTWITVGMNPTREVVLLSHGLYGRNVPDEVNQYLMFLDLDADPTTGGKPADLGFNTAFEGAEVVTQVLVRSRFARPTVWQFDGSSFVDVTGPNVEASVQSPAGGEDLLEIHDVVTLQMSIGITGILRPTVRVQAIAEQLGPGNDFDVLPGGTKAEPGADGDFVYIVPPEFPVCSADPRQVQPGDAVKIEATGFRQANQPVHVILGDLPVAEAMLDDKGDLVTAFVVPPDARQGLRLITVGINKTALTADCVLQVGDVVPPEQLPEPTREPTAG